MEALVCPKFVGLVDFEMCVASGVPSALQTRGQKCTDCKSVQAIKPEIHGLQIGASYKAKRFAIYEYLKAD